MTLDPRERKSWEGFLDLLQPPVGYRLAAAVGTSFGVSIDALTAALLAMCDADGEALASDPVASVMAATRLQAKVRVLVHPGTISGSTQPGSSRFVAMLDRVIVEVDSPGGLFHPKVWALRFDRRTGSSSSQPKSIGRLLVSSRNLSPSTCFEMGAVFEGHPSPEGEPGSHFCVQVADALQAWLGTTKRRVPPSVWALPMFVRQLVLESPREAADAVSFHWQGAGRPLAAVLPQQLDRAVVVSPFLQPEFLSAVVQRVRHLQVVSTPASLDALDDQTFQRLEQARVAQGSPVLYQVTQLGEPDGGFIDSVHAKLLLIEHRGGASTFVGSANATGPGWGLGRSMNVEAMVQMQPGVGIDRFVATFLRQNKTKVHPWIAEYDRSARTDVDPEREAERQMLAALRQVARIDPELLYDAQSETLTVDVAAPKSKYLVDAYPGIVFDFCPLLLADRDTTWTPIQQLGVGQCRFVDVPLEKLTAFLAFRARSKEPPLERTRLVLGRLNLSDADLDKRDAVVRHDIMATANPAAVLNALVRGLAYAPGVLVHGEGRGGATNDSLARIFQEANLERLLQAIASEPGLVSEMRLLLGPAAGAAFQRFCDDLESVVVRVQAEVAS